MNDIVSFALIALLLFISPGTNSALILKTPAANGHSAACANILGLATATFIHGAFAIFSLAAKKLSGSAALCLLCLLPLSTAWAGSGEVLAKAAQDRTAYSVKYDGSYYAIPYPNGDVPEHVGVCSDVVIRSYRSLGVDLQKRVHEDILANFAEYPSHRIWGLTKPDRNIDHRRVPNLRVFFSRNGQSFAISDNPKDYQAGDIVSWVLRGNLPHIGIVAAEFSPLSGNPMIIHNIGAGPKMEDKLFAYKITGHYRYLP